MLLAALFSTANAASPEVALGIGGTGESVTQDGLGRLYGKMGGSFSAEGFISAHGTWPVEVALEVGYRRLSGETTSGASSWFEYIPVSVVASGRLDVGSVALLGGLGPAMVSWQERPSESAVPGRQDWGVRWGVLFEGSVRWHTPWLTPSPNLPAKGLDLFAFGGYRLSHVADGAGPCSEEPCGIDMSALRLGGGALVRF